MNQPNEKAAALLAALLAVAPSALAAGPPRGMNVEPLAGNCAIGTFPQTTKAGPYNALCQTMPDAEKCLALIKGQFELSGATVTVTPVDAQDEAKAQFCLDVLKQDLGL